jgi:hypothetical protein
VLWKGWARNIRERHSRLPLVPLYFCMKTGRVSTDLNHSKSSCHPCWCRWHRREEPSQTRLQSYNSEKLGVVRLTISCDVRSGWRQTISEPTVTPSEIIVNVNHHGDGASFKYLFRHTLEFHPYPPSLTGEQVPNFQLRRAQIQRHQVK